ncbi:DUF3558 domain-containing protein [Smaragdicoccus niigatensis]
MAALVLAALIGACAIQGKAVQAHVWDPCTGLPDQALRQAGAVPMTKNETGQPVGWHVCRWETTNGRYWLVVSSSGDGMSTIRRDATYSDFQTANVGDRVGETYLLANDRRAGCTVGIDTAFGSVHVEMTNEKGESVEVTCPLALSVSLALLRYLPE